MKNEYVSRHDMNGLNMAPRVTQDIEAGVDSKADQGEARQQEGINRKRRITLWLWLAIAILVLVFGLAVGLSQRNNNDNNLAIFDEAVALIEANERQFKDLPNGETISYREYNKGQPHKIVMLPGFGADDMSFAPLAVLREFHDHHIIAVNPTGWWESSMNKPIYDHEEHADEVLELLRLMNIDKAMVAGYSTGGGIAFYMAQKYPESIPIAFLLHSIPLHGMTTFDLETGKPLPVDDVEEVERIVDSMLPADINSDNIAELWKMYSTNPEGFPPKSHKVSEYWATAFQKMPGKAAASIANSKFNVTPIRTRYSEPNNKLQGLKAKVVVIHSERDMMPQMTYVTQLAIADKWAPPGMLSYYNDDEGHMVGIDKPAALAKVYRTAFNEQLLD